MLLRLERFANASEFTSSQTTPLPANGVAAVPFPQSPLAVRSPKPPLELHTSGSASINGHPTELYGKMPTSSNSPTASRTPTGSSYGNANTQPRIFPGIVHDRHRRTSVRQGSGSETDPESLAGSWISEGKKCSRSVESNNALQVSVLEEAAEDA